MRLDELAAKIDAQVEGDSSIDISSARLLFASFLRDEYANPEERARVLGAVFREKLISEEEYHYHLLQCASDGLEQGEDELVIDAIVDDERPSSLREAIRRV